MLWNCWTKTLFIKLKGKIMTNQKYAVSSKLIHWFMAALIIFLLALGFYMEEFLSKEATNRMEIYNLHKSFGVVALIFIAVRIINRLIFAVPALPNSMPKIEKALAHLGHLALYILMILMPISGYLMSNSFGYPVKLFAIEMPKIAETNFDLGKIYGTIHGLAAYCLLAVLSLHIIAVIKHRFFDKPENDVLKRMI